MLELLASQGAIAFIGALSALVIGFTVHEYAHAWSAYQLGDMTAYEQGRLTLDPRSHIEPIGAILMLLAGFGWAKPVPINPYILGKRGTLWVSLAGPASNILLAVLAGFVMRAFTNLTTLGINIEPYWPLFGYFIFFNVLLAVFNMLPVAPLDGWKVLLGLVSPELEFKLRPLERYGFVILMILIFSGSLLGGPSLISMLISGPINTISSFIFENIAGLSF